MAKLCVAYGLCPLIDQRSLLGISEDSVSGYVIVTVGKNIVIRYRLQDQKQITSWSTKDKLTSPVTYDGVSCQYAAVFNHNQLRMWTDTEERLDKVKKYKFEEPIFCIIPQTDGDPAIVLFRNGCVALLAVAIESRKEAINGPSLKKDEVIKDYCVVANSGRKLVTLITRDTQDRATLHIVPIVLGETTSYYVLHRDDAHLLGQTMVQRDDSCILLTLWSDGKLFSFPFLPHEQEKFPGTLLQSVTAISSKNPAQLVTLSSSHVALFGSDPSEEGATLVLINLHFQLIQGRLHFKLYSKPPRLWNVGANLLVAVGNNLVVVPYQLDAERLSSLVGSHIAPIAASQETKTEVEWFDTKVKILKKKLLSDILPQNIRDLIIELRNQAVSEAVIVDNVVPQLLEKKLVSALIWCLEYFTDISENCMTQALIFCLSEPDATFLDGTLSNHMGNSDVVKQNGDVAMSTDEDISSTADKVTQLKHTDKKDNSQVLVPAGRARLMDVIINVPFSDVYLIPHLHSVPFALVLTLLSHLGHLLKNNGSILEVRLLEWISLLLDAHYQQYLLSQDPEVLTQLTSLRSLVNSQLCYHEDLKNMVPILHKLKRGKLPVRSHFSGKRYSVELLQLY